MNRVLFLDLDDTLIPSSRGYQVALTQVGIGAEDSIFFAARKRVKERLGHGHVSARNRFLYFKAYLEMKKSFSPKRLLALSEKYEAALIRYLKDEWQASGYSSVLKEVSQRYQIAIITNENTRTQIQKLQIIDPDSKWIKYVFCSEEFGREKPDPDFISFAMGQTGAIPKESTMVGDDPIKDLEPADQLGLRCLWATEYIEKLSPPPAFKELPKFSRLKELLL